MPRSTLRDAIPSEVHLRSSTPKRSPPPDAHRPPARSSATTSFRHRRSRPRVRHVAIRRSPHGWARARSRSSSAGRSCSTPARRPCRGQLAARIPWCRPRRDRPTQKHPSRLKRALRRSRSRSSAGPGSSESSARKESLTRRTPSASSCSWKRPAEGTSALSGDQLSPRSAAASGCTATGSGRRSTAAKPCTLAERPVVPGHGSLKLGVHRSLLHSLSGAMRQHHSTSFSAWETISSRGWGARFKPLRHLEQARRKRLDRLDPEGHVLHGAAINRGDFWRHGPGGTKCEGSSGCLAGLSGELGERGQP